MKESATPVLVLGGAGMLGHTPFQALRERFDGTIATTCEDIRNAVSAAVTAQVAGSMSGQKRDSS